LITTRWLSNPDSEASEMIEAWTYDSSGRLLTDTVRTASGALTEKVYSYDDKGRLLRIVEGSGDHTSFQYDEEGGKVEIRERMPKADGQERAMATGVDSIFADAEGTLGYGLDGIRNASTTKTIYNERDQPTEMHAFDADGHLLSRISRTYDEKHGITSLKVTNEDPGSLFPAKQIAEIAAETGVPLAEIKAQMEKAVSAMMGESARYFTYDAQGRRAKIVLRNPPLGEVSRTCSYNDQGDVVEERTTVTRDSRFPVGVPFHSDESGNLVPEKPPSEWPPQPQLPESIVRYQYQYDNFGNWTEQTVTRSEGLEYTRRRELTYY
jgi:YD repeat-containing protein